MLDLFPFKILISTYPTYDMMILFNDFMMIILTFIMTLILFIMFKSLSNKFINYFLLEYQMIEIIWTITPMFILIFVAIPTIKIIYLIEIFNNNSSIKAVGHQWYWSYSDFLNIDFDSFMIPINQLMMNEFHLLDVDNRCIHLTSQFEF